MLSRCLVERLRRELYDSEQNSASLESSLRCKDQECESLTRLVRELTAARAKAASAKHHLQASSWTLHRSRSKVQGSTSVQTITVCMRTYRDLNMGIALPDACRSE